MTNFQHIQPGNIVPNEWYKRFSTPDGPDLVCITLLADIIALFRFGSNLYESNDPNFPKFTGDSLSLSYEYFEEKFGFSKERARRAFVRLESLNILKRQICNIKSSLNKRVNRLFITLDTVFFNSCFRNAELDIRVEAKEENQSPHERGDHIISNKNLKEDRSIASAKSNSFKNSSSDLKAFYPLSEEDAHELRSLSGREFSLRAMNQILLDMSQRVKDRWFKGKKYFLNYMAKVFKYELRDAVKTSNETFYIKNNLKIQEDSVQKEVDRMFEIKRQEEYLTEIEYSRDASPEWHLKRKLASVLERSKAYNLLNSYVSSRLEGGIFIFNLSKCLDFSQMDRKIILEQLNAVYGVINEFKIHFLV